MEIKTYSIGNANYTFVCEAIGTRHGFAHVVHLFRDNYEISRARCNYLNRAWERYRFQTAMMNALFQAFQDEKDRIKSAYKYAHGLSRVSRDRIDPEYQKSPLLSEYAELRDAL